MPDRGTCSELPIRTLSDAAVRPRRVPVPHGGGRLWIGWTPSRSRSPRRPARFSPIATGVAETAARPGCFYQSRRVRDSPLYRLAEEHFETFKQVYDDRFASRYGFWRAEVERTLLAFLDCGLPERGFARIRCPSCRHEFLLAFSCKARGYCMSCHAKRAALWAEHLAERVLLPVPHEQWVFTLPKRLRLFFLYDRTLLGDLARCAWGTVRDLYLAGLPNRSAVPGLVASVQTYGDLANWNPRS